ncbi:MAG: tRNA preQ1(34) S-adenosylmethionine ribosyltransferase-isomerase QueA, partial [Candidatus Cloacimonetes bacterium]|nr:tRNA preQ1(34) S-adenosylmethionine ribosyltransferase-isomerase QueA [Candidatus Cloacimonadota bacterium]
MKTKEFYFNLPENLIAQNPQDKRDSSRLLVVDRNSDDLIESSIKDFPSFLEEDSLLVLNNTKVRKGRVYALSENKGKVEFLFLNYLGANRWTVVVSKSKKQKVGKRFFFGTISGTIVEELGEGSKVFEFDEMIDESFFEAMGHVPLPPYIKRDDQEFDKVRYQTIYAKNLGSVAAPTAGLHFTEDILKEIENRGIEIAQITLHVGMGTFIPMRGENLEDHKMHYEHYEIDDLAASLINTYHKNKKKVIAVGTTVVRTLESAYDAKSDLVVSGMGKTNLFIKP